MIDNHALESVFARGMEHLSWLDTIHGPLDTPKVETIEKACELIWNRKGKRLRCHFVYWFGEAYGINPKDLELYAWAVEAIHTATMLHDDVIDRAEMRRGGPSSNLVFDNTIPILSGDYLMSDAIYQLALKGHPELMRNMCSALKDLTQGEVIQYQNQFKVPDSDTLYHQISDLKTASLLKWAASVGPTLKDSGDKISVIEFAKAFGLLFQLTDDILDLKGTHTKSKNQDLSEGKVNWATWQILQNEPQLKTRLKKEFESKTVTEESKTLLLGALNKPSNQKALENCLLSVKNQCLMNLENLESNSLCQLLTHLVDFTTSRVY